MSTILSDRGELKLGTKPGIVRCLEDGTEEKYDITPIVEVVMLDGSDIMYVLKHAAARKFPEYAQDVFLPYVEHQLGKARTIDVVWDNYRPDSLKVQSESVAASSPIMQFQKMGRISQNQLEQPSAVRIHEQRHSHNTNTLGVRQVCATCSTDLMVESHYSVWADVCHRFEMSETPSKHR